MAKNKSFHRLGSRTVQRLLIATAAAFIVTAGALIALSPANAEWPRAKEGRTLYFDVAVAETPASGCKIEYNYFTESGAAKSGQDFKATRGTLVFYRGDRIKRIGVVTLTDNCREKNETVNLVVTDGKTIDLAAWAHFCHYVELWRKKVFRGTIVDDGSVSSTYESDKYGCSSTGTRFGE